MYLDEDRNFYRQFNLPCTMKQVWSLDSLTGYAEFICNERILFSMEDGDDPHQLGGDFIVSQNGTLEFLHRSKTPMDRPTVSTLLEKVESFK